MLSSRARRRHERGLERAEEIVDRTAVKIRKSKRSASNIANRKKAWDDVNGSVEKPSGNKFAELADQGEDDEEEEEESVEEFDDEMADAAVPTAPATAKAATASPPADDDDEEIL